MTIHPLAWFRPRKPDSATATAKLTADVIAAKEPYADACRRRDTRAQNSSWRPLFDARTAQLRAEVAR